MGDFFTNNLWEEEPDFAKDDYNNEYGEEAGGQNDDNENYYGAQHVIALVDCHPAMFEKWERIDHEKNAIDTSPIDMSIKLIHSLLQQTIEQTVIRKTGKRNGVGLFLYNIKANCSDTKDGDGNNNREDDDDDDDKMDDEDDDDDDEHGDDEEEFTQHQVETTVHRLLDLEPPGISQVKNLGKLLSNDRQQKRPDRDLHAEFCPSERDLDLAVAPLQTALEEAMQMFLSAKCVRDPMKNAKGKNEYDSRSIWIFTNQEDPYSDEKKQLIENIANLAREQRISIVVWPLPIRSDDNTGAFNSPFFESISSMVIQVVSKEGDESEHDDEDDDEHELKRLQYDTDMLEGLEEIYGSMSKKRRTYYTPLHILHRRKEKWVDSNGHDRPSIMIDWYSLVQLSRRPGKVQIDTETKTETVKVRLTLEKDTGREVARFWTKPTIEQREQQRDQAGVRRFRQFYSFADELIPITQEDTKTMRENANAGFAPGLTILGFKPKDAIPSHHSLSKTLLIFPNDTDVQGSCTAFAHLHAAMMRKKVIGIGEALFRETSQSRLVAIHPFEESDYLPPGMYVTTLPFEDDMRAVVPDAASMEFDFRQKQQRQCQSIHQHKSPSRTNEPDSVVTSGKVLVEGEEPDAVGSTTFQDTVGREYVTGNIASEELINAAIKLIERQSLRTEEMGVSFENSALVEFYSYLKSIAFDMPKEENVYDTIINKELLLKTAGKEISVFDSLLPLDVERAKAIPSRKRVRKVVPDDSGIDWNKLHRKGEIGTCKMDQLKKYLRSVGLATSGRKSDLVERIGRSLEENFENDTKTNIKVEESDTTKMEDDGLMQTI